MTHVIFNPHLKITDHSVTLPLKYKAVVVEVAFPLLSYMIRVILISYFRTTRNFLPVKKPLLHNSAVY